MLRELGPAAWGENSADLDATKITEAFANKLFAELTPGEQSLVLLLRALASEPKFLILDEAFSGMDERMIEVASTYLRERLAPTQSVVWVSHWEAEAPWGVKEGVKRFVLEEGVGKVV